MTREEIIALIRARAQASGIDPNHALAMASIESNFNPRAVNPAGTHKGLYQFGPSEWKQWGGGGDIFDPNAQLGAYVGYHGNIRDELTKALGRPPTPQEMYLGWQQGAGGAGKLITNPLTSAPAMIGNSAFSANGGVSGQNSQQFVGQWADTYNKHLAQVGGAQPAAQPDTGLLSPAGQYAAGATGSRPVLPGQLAADDAASKAAVAAEANRYMAAGSMATKMGTEMMKPPPPVQYQQLQASFNEPKELAPFPDFTMGGGMGGAGGGGFAQQLAQSRLQRKRPGGM